MDKNSIWFLRLAAGVIIVTFGLIPIFKFFDNKRKNDIVVKTDLNESYILRDSSLVSVDFTKDDLIKLFKEDKLQIEKALKNEKDELTKIQNNPRPAWMEEKIKGCVKYKTKKQRDYCFNVYTPIPGNLKEQKSKVKIEELKLELVNLSIDEISKVEESIFLKKLNFRPIFKDLNGSYSNRDYEKVACQNPKLNISIIKLIDDKKGQFSERENKKLDEFPLSDGYVIPKYDGLALDSLKIAACKKYAKFED